MITQYLKIISYNLYILGLLLITSCNNNGSSLQLNNALTTKENPTSTFYKILPLGDSRVEGATSNSVSYRYYLWKNMVKHHWNFDFIGTQNDRSKYPELLDKTFDPNHEGIGGSKTQDILDNIDDIIKDLGVPDVVLLGIGGNDLVTNRSVTSTIENINQTIDLLQNSNSSITVFIERIAPARSNVMTPENLVIYNSFNSSITALAKEQSSKTSKIIAIDMAANWTDDYMADNLHYNDLGAKEVANRYYDAIEENLEK